MLYWPQLDGLRTLAFLLVFMSHLPIFPIATLKSPPELLKALYHVYLGITYWGWAGVDLFFVLSAFLITTLLLQERRTYGEVSFKSFFTRRMFRIWPLYYGFIVLVFFLLPMIGYGGLPHLGTSAWVETLSQVMPFYLPFLANFYLTLPNLQLTLPNFVYIPWSVSIEEQFYVVWGGLMAKIAKLDTLFWIVVGALPVAMGFRWYLLETTESHLASYNHTLSHLDPILFGAVAAILVANGRITSERVQKYGVFLFLGPLLFFLGLTMFVSRDILNEWPMVFLMPLMAFSAVAFLLAILYYPPVSRVFSVSSLTKMGQRTYGMYMLHTLAIAVSTSCTLFLLQHFPVALPVEDIWIFWLINVLIAFALTRIFAEISWQLLEKHFYKRRLKYAKVPSGFAG